MLDNVTSNLPSTDLDTVQFGNETPVQKAEKALPALRWFNRLPREDGEGNADGFHVERYKFPALDAFLEEQQVPAYRVIHELTGNIVEYWRFGACSLYVVCNGVMGAFEMGMKEERKGIAYSWNIQKKQSKLRLKCYIQELAIRGYCEPFQLALSGTITKSALESLAAQDRVLTFYKNLRKQQGKPVDEPFFFSFSLPIGPAKQKVVIGQAKVLPMISLVPADLTVDFLKKRLCPPDLLKKIKEELPETITWSRDVSKRMLLEEETSAENENQSAEPGEEYEHEAAFPEGEFTLGEEVVEPEPDPLISPTDVVILRKRLTDSQKQQLFAKLAIADLAELKAEQAQQILAKLQAAKKATKSANK